jgi:hypothetical protein
MKQRKRKIWRLPILALALAAIVAPTAQGRPLSKSGTVITSSSSPSQSYSPQARYALEVRSEAMNRLYGHSASSSPYALELRSEALKRLRSEASTSHSYSPQALYALELRSEAMNGRYSELQGKDSRTAVASSSGFDWSDAGIGAGTAFGAAFVLLGGLLVARRRKGQLAV